MPADVVSDIVVAYSRDNVLFDRSGDGYSWAEAVVPKWVQRPPAED